MRALQHDNLQSLKEAREGFQAQVSRMQRAFGAQVNNMEGFAVEIACKKFAELVKEAHFTFNKEIARFAEDYQKLQDVILHYEDRIRKLVGTITGLERMVVELN